MPGEVGGLPVRDLIQANPLSRFVEAARSSLYLLEAPSTSTTAVIVVVSTFSLLAGWWVFHRKAVELTEEL